MTTLQHAPRERIAVVGSGIAGLTCAHVLGPHHDVVLYEAASRLGGHANTVDVDDPAAGRIQVDTGFIVHNDRNYPNLVALFDELGVATVDTEMSFGVTDRDPASPTSGFTYRATSPNTMFADRRNVVRPAMWRMLRDVARFYRAARAFLDDGDDETTLTQFLDDAGYSREFVELHLLPMGASVWSADPARFAEFPARTLFRFLDNHGLLGVGDRPQWRTIPGGSRVYVDAIAARFPGEIRLASPVESVRRTADGVEVTANGRVDRFDRVVLATHSDQALAMLVDPSPVEQKVLGAVRYQPNRATLHTDTSLLSPHRRAWSAWNYERHGDDQRAATLTYDMTELQHLPGSRRYLVSLNSDDRIDPDTVLARFDYAHPVFDGDAIEAQRRFDEIDGVDRIHYCGAWWGYGFHEDGMASALRVCHRIGVHWPHSTLRHDRTGSAPSNLTVVPPVTFDTAEPVGLQPGAPAVCDGTVFHRRTSPQRHEFRYGVSYVWLDPDDPGALTAAHALWSSERWAPARFRRRDYGAASTGSLADAARDELTPVLGRRPEGPVRMLTQVRRWGWLFNPITVYVVWDAGADPVGAVLEVTNTPWKERHRYPVALERDGAWLRSSVHKELHVSPFLDEAHRYDLRLRGDDRRLHVRIDVVPDGAERPILETGLTVDRAPVDRRVLTTALVRRFASTHRVSIGIHWQALRLWLRRVPFVPHPSKRAAS
ncbi:MAG: FAD-dependent oxidoreductase [Acidimicrobiia bacterium]